MKREKSRLAKAAGAKRSTKPAHKKGARPAAKPSDTIETLMAASAEALGLTIDPAWRHSVAFNLALILRHAALVDEFKLPDDAEPAPVFHA
jgi:1-carboxybiuret hydrolase subunit AtzG-like